MFVVHDPKHGETVEQLEIDKGRLQAKINQCKVLIRALNSEILSLESRSENQMGRRLSRQAFPIELENLLKEIVYV